MTTSQAASQILESAKELQVDDSMFCFLLELKSLLWIKEQQIWIIFLESIQYNYQRSLSIGEITLGFLIKCSKIRLPQLELTREGHQLENRFQV
jgi:hypothetical protein